MARYQRSLWWAFHQFINHLLQDLAYQYDAGCCLPQRIIFCLTLRCNIRCKQCGIWRTPNKKEITTEEWKKVIMELKHWLGSYRVQIAGGEIFLRDDIVELVKFASGNGVLMGIVSNGTMIHERMAEELVAAGLNYLDISIDAMNPDLHDYIRGVKGVYEKASRAIHYVKNFRDKAKSDLSIGLATVIMGPNMDELVDIVNWVQEEGLNCINLNPLGPACDSDPQWYSHSELWPKPKDLPKLDSILDQLIEMKKGGAAILNSEDQLLAMKTYFRNPSIVMGNHCMVGVTNFLLSCEGEIHACFHMPPIGNLEQSFKTVWKSETAKSVRQKIKSCHYECSPGNASYRRSVIKEIERYLQFK